MKNSSNKIYALVIILGGVLVGCGIWFGFLSGYLKSTNDVERAQQLFVSQPPAPTSAETTMAPEPQQLVQGVPKRGQAFAIMRIPSLGSDWIRTVSEGTTLGILDRLGIGHYEKSEFPNEPGNFALAGHSGNRWTPFAKYQEIEIGGLIEIETYDTKYVYEVIETVIVDETDIKTIYDNPSLKSDTAGKSWLTITTCLKDGLDNKRYAIYAQLISSTPKT